MKVLVVDDQEINRTLLSFILEDEGYQYHMASDGEQAIQLYIDEQPDLILMDIMMPGIDGYEAARKIKEQAGNRHIPIIFLTAKTDLESLSRCLDDGEDFLTKPFNEVILKAKIRAHRRVAVLYKQLNDKNDALTFHNSRIQQEQLMAQRVFSNVMEKNPNHCTNLSHYLSSASVFSGDLFLYNRSPSGGLYLLLGDFTGHGLPAAIGAIPTSQIFFQMSARGEAVSDIAREINRELWSILPSHMFCAAAVVEVNKTGSQLTLWQGGLPDILLASSHSVDDSSIDDVSIKVLEPLHLPLGMVGDGDFEDDVKVIAVEPTDIMYAYTDGITEAVSSQGNMYGIDGLVSAVKDNASNGLRGIIEHWKGFCAVDQEYDDVSLVELNFGHVDWADEPIAAETAEHKITPCTMNWAFTGEQLSDIRCVDSIVAMVEPFFSEAVRKDLLRLVLNEMYSNSLEHGILRLKSELKNSVEGLEHYEQLRAERLFELSDSDWIKIEAHLCTSMGQAYLDLELSDSGKGFDVAEVTTRPENDSLSHGRGLGLIRYLCESVEFYNSGASVRARFSL
ncbi:fused response regulator/phosphatase [Litoribrevibacter albus]|uniref:Fused response regulator/phosphatase n=1 Tax=Litoribrevibacter albus TaxID=1473156 RepID=A0AA37S881_9GAMM|nr:fused response regulator/phosphatase [Litoribrevibacter albus]GLQ29838.1 fused response regulator/phosphatase [Litoribrevibacter albus]